MATIQIWNRCNNRCIMCTNPLWFPKESTASYSYQRIVARIKQITSHELAGGFHISGGEPTLHPDFFGILRFIRKAFPRQKIHVLSNGRMFMYEKFAEQTLSFDNSVLQIPFFGHRAQLHDRITGVRGSFDQTVSGVKNILKHRHAGQKLEIRVVLVRQNLASVDKIVSFAHGSFSPIDTFVMIFPEPEGRCLEGFEHMGIRYSQAKKIIFEAVQKWKRVFSDLRLYHFPLCTIDYRLWPFNWITQYPEEVMSARACLACSLKKYCPGIHKNYLKKCGSREFRGRTAEKILSLHTGKEGVYHPIKLVR